MSDPTVRRVLIAGGIGAVGLGVVAMVVPEVVGIVGGSGALVSLLGVVALVQAAHATSDFWELERRSADLPDAYRNESATVPGETFDRALQLSARRGRVGRRNRDRITSYVRHAAVVTLAAETDATSEAVRPRLDDGTWTDDPAAAALFVDTHDLTWRDHLRAAAGRETTFQRRVRRAVVALERHAEGVDRE